MEKIVAEIYYFLMLSSVIYSYIYNLSDGIFGTVTVVLLFMLAVTIIESITNKTNRINTLLKQKVTLLKFLGIIGQILFYCIIYFISLIILSLLYDAF